MATDQSYSTADAPAMPEANTESHWPPMPGDAFWHTSAPGGVRRHYRSGDAAGGWKRWRRHLLGRSGAWIAGELAELLAGSRKKGAGALAWGTSGSIHDNQRLAWLLKVADARPRRARELATDAPAHIEYWLAETADLQHWTPTAEEAFEAVAWVRGLTALVRVCDSEMWWQLLERLHYLARIAAVPLEASPLANQLACGELPWSLATLFSEIAPCRQLAPAAAKALSKGIADLLDGAGMPHSRHLSIFHRLVAIWTRCRLLAAAVGSASAKSALGDCWDDDAEQEFFQAVREAIRLTRCDGTPVLSDPDGAAAQPTPGASIRWLTDIAAGLAGDGDRDGNKHYRRAMAAIAAGRESKRSRGRALKRLPKDLPDPAIHSEWAELAVMQTDWSSRATRLAVAYSGRDVRIELQSDRQFLVSGVWEFDVRANGVLAAPQGTWSEVCWVSDTDCDYLELEIELSRSIRVQRQILLSRKDQFVFLADAILGDEPRDLAYRGRLPLAAGIAAQPANETRELTLVGKQPRAVVLPLELPEWRADSRSDSLAANEAGQAGTAERQPDAAKINAAAKANSANPSVAANGAATNGAARNGTFANNPPANDAESGGAAHAALELSQSNHGCRLFAPLWIDLSRKRAGNQQRDPLTWRQLTIGEQRQIMPRDVAVGYRVQCGEQQWVVYRSLAAPGNRTLLGINLSTDFFVGRFGSDGETESVVEIE